MAATARLSLNRIMTVGQKVYPLTAFGKPYLLATDRTGQLVDSTTYPGQLPDGYFVHILALPNESAIIQGQMVDYLWINNQPYVNTTLLHVDSMGTILWQRSFDPH